MTDTNADNEPSMEEILASIRRIISDGEDPAAVGGAVPQLAHDSDADRAEPPPDATLEEFVPTHPPAALSPVPIQEPAPQPEDDILDLTQMVTEQGEVVDLNAAKSARGLLPPEDGGGLGDRLSGFAEEGAEPAPGAVTVEDVSRAVEALAESVAAQDPTEARETWPENTSEEPAPVTAGSVAPEEDPLSDLDLVEEAIAAFDSQAGAEAAPAFAEPTYPEETPGFEPQAESLAPQDFDGLGLGEAPQAERQEQFVDVAATPEPIPIEEEPLDLHGSLPEAPVGDQGGPAEGATGAGEESANADETLSEIDQILARAREAADAQAAAAQVDQGLGPESSAPQQDYSPSAFGGIEGQAEELSDHLDAENRMAATQDSFAAHPSPAREEVSAPRGAFGGIRAAVEESLGLRRASQGHGGEDTRANAAEQQNGAAVEAETEALLAGLEASISDGPEEHDVNTKKDEMNFNSRNASSHPSADSGLISSSTAAGAISALGDLARASRESNGGRVGGTSLGGNRTLEEVVVNAMGPHLKAWMDTNLEPLVERIVREEIQRLRRRSEDF